MLIDNTQPINYEQLYAQLMYEIHEMQVPYWFTTDEEERIQQMNLPFMKGENLEMMIGYFYKVPEKHEAGQWMLIGDMISNMQVSYPELTDNRSTRIKFGQILRILGCVSKETKQGMMYQLINLQAA